MGFDSVWFTEHHFRPVWSHNSAPDLTLAAISQRTSRIRLGIGVVLAPIHHPLHVAARMATLDILSRGRVDVGIGRTGYPYQLTPSLIGSRALVAYGDVDGPSAANNHPWSKK